MAYIKISEYILHAEGYKRSNTDVGLKEGTFLHQSVQSFILPA